MVNGAKRKRPIIPSSESESSDRSDTESVSSINSDELDSARLRLKPVSSATATTMSSGPGGLTDLSDTAVVYRATNRIQLSLGQTQISCGKCPQFGFCEEGGPVNAEECSYLQDWLSDSVGGWAAGMVLEGETR